MVHVLPTTQFAYRKCLGTCDALFVFPIHYKVHWKMHGQEARIVQIDFSAAINWVNYHGILYKLCSVVLEVLSCLY